MIRVLSICLLQVKVDMTQPSDADDDEDSPRPTGEVGVGVFVMYNYARLATLLDNFGKAVQEGMLDNIRYLGF